MQKLQLSIRRISLLKGDGADQISFCVPNDQVLDKVLGDTQARQLFPELYFDLKITKDKGEDLLAALGLTADKVIDTTANRKMEFGRNHEKKL